MTTPMTLEQVRDWHLDVANDLRNGGHTFTTAFTSHCELAETCEAAIRSRDEQAKVIARLKNPWRSIESAPKDGTWVLGLWIYHGEPVYRLCAFRNGSWLQKPGDWIAIATHWMPLPPPPNVGEKE